MSLNQRLAHRRLQARQDRGGDGGNNPLTNLFPDPTTTSSSSETTSTTSQSTSTTTSANGGNGGHGGHQITTSTSSSSTKTSFSETKTSTSTSTSSEETTTSSSSESTSSTTSKTSSSTTETSTSSSSTTEQTSNTVSNTIKLVTTGQTALVSHTTSFAGTSIDSAPTETTAPPASGSLNTGAMVGGIAGGLIVVALIGAIIAFYLRRLKNRRRADEFDAAQFRRSAMVVDGESRPTSFWGGAVRPISTFFQSSFRPGHNVAPSISSTQGAGLAGQGAWKNQYQNQEYYADDQQQPEMVQTTMAQTTTPAPQGGRGLQPKQQYTFGQTYEPEPSPTSAAAFVAPGSASSHGHAAEDYDPYAVAGTSHYATGHAYSQTQNIDYHHAHNGTQPTRDEDAYGGM